MNAHTELLYFFLSLSLVSGADCWWGGGQKRPSNRCRTKEQRALYLFAPALPSFCLFSVFLHFHTLTLLSALFRGMSTMWWKATDTTHTERVKRKIGVSGFHCALKRCLGMQAAKSGRMAPTGKVCMQFTVANTVIWNRELEHPHVYIYMQAHRQIHIAYTQHVSHCLVSTSVKYWFLCSGHCFALPALMHAGQTGANYYRVPETKQRCKWIKSQNSDVS